MKPWDPRYRGIVAERTSCLGQAGSCYPVSSPLLQDQQHSPLKDLELTERMLIFCLNCQSLCPPGQVICSEKCHETLIQRLEQEFGTHMKVVDLKTMKAYCVPLRDIVEGGLRRKNLKYFSEWKWKMEVSLVIHIVARVLFSSFSPMEKQSEYNQSD
jgi:hypothetical protein